MLHGQESDFVLRNPEQAHGFVITIAEIRRRARRHIQQGRNKPGDPADRDTILRLLNEALATELVCVHRYKRHYHMVDATVAQSIKDELLRHANDEQDHADRLALRIVELGGTPNLSPQGLLGPSFWDDPEAETPAEMLAEDLIAERIAIENFREIIGYVGDSDPGTRQLFEWILAVEQEQVKDVLSLREDLLLKAASY